jgi:molecular chaperone GrpE
MSPEPPKPKRKQDERIAELEAQLTDAQKTAETHLNQLKYAKADLDNLQKQTQKRIEEATDRAAARVLGELLTVADELTIIASADGARSDALNMTLGKLLKILEAEGVRPIEACGNKFDPYKHEAVLEVETPDEPEGTVVEEIRRGYTYRDKVLRASMVKVAKAPSHKETPRDV